MYPDYPFKSNYFVKESNRIHYVDEGEGDIIVMVHGNPTWSFYYRRLISLLRLSHRVIAVDHLGCGLSDKPQDYNYCMQNHIDNLADLLDHLQVQSFSLCVHDWGGAIGFGMAARKNNSLQRALVFNTAAFRSKRIPFRINICRMPVIGSFLVRALNGFAGPAVFMAVKKKMERSVAKAYLAPYSSWQNRIAVSAFVQDIPLSSTHPSYKSLLAVEKGLEEFQKRNLPILLCWGGLDFCFNTSFYDEWCSRFPHAQKHFFADSGHYVLEDSFDAIAPLATAFFQ